MSTSFIRSIGFTLGCLESFNGSLEEIPSLFDVFKETTQSNYTELTSSQKEDLDKIYKKIYAMPALLHPGCVEASIVYKKITSALSIETVVPEELHSWQQSANMNEREAYNRIIAYIQTDRSDVLDLSDLELSRIPDCLLTDSRFDKAHIIGLPLKTFPNPNAGQVKNWSVYSQLREILEDSVFGRLLIHPEDIKHRLINDAENRVAIANFLIEHQKELPNVTTHLGFILSKELPVGEVKQLLELISCLDERQQTEIIDACFFYLPSFRMGNRDLLFSLIEVALESKKIFIADHLIQYMVCDVLLDEGLSPFMVVGNSSSCVIECFSAHFFLDKMIKKYTPDSLSENFCAKIVVSKDILFDSLLRLVDTAAFLCQHVVDDIHQIIEQLIPSEKEQLIAVLDKVPISEDRTADLHMHYKKSLYSATEVSCFEERSAAVIQEAVSKIRLCSTKEDLLCCYNNLFDLFGEVRYEIAEQDKSVQAPLFGRTRERNLRTPFEGAYIEYGYKVFNFLQNLCLELYDTKKESSLSKALIEGVSISWQDLHPRIPITIRVKYKNSTLSAGVRVRDEHLIGGYRLQIDHDRGLEKGRLPPPECLKEFVVIQSLAYQIPAIKKDIQDAFVRACSFSDMDNIKEALAEFAYLFAYAAPYNRGSAAIGEWFLKSICLAKGLYFEYGSAEKKGNVIYRSTSDLDALSSTFSEFKADFMEKAHFCSTPIEKMSMVRSVGATEEMLLKKVFYLDKIGPVSAIQAHQIELQKIDLLHFAIQKNYLSLVQLLIIESGLSVNTTNGRGCSLLFVACNRGHIDIVRFLLEQENIDVNLQRTDGATALLVAAQKGYTEVVEKLLLHRDIDPDLANNSGLTPLHAACLEDQITIIPLLVKKMNFTKTKKEIFIYFAEKKCSSRVLNLLKESFLL